MYVACSLPLEGVLPGPGTGAAVQVPVPSALLLPTEPAFWLHICCLLPAFEGVFLAC